jgi:hypothetical protein
MRNRVLDGFVALVTILALSLAVMAQAPASQGGRGGAQATPGMIAPGVPKMPNPPGPAPKRDLNGAWVGPLLTAREEIPPMTPAGAARFKLNRPQSVVSLAATNDPFVTCDPLGLTRGIISHAFQNKEGVWFDQVPNRMIILQQYQRVWRDAWMDGRELPKKVDARGAPDSRFYGYSVGHWDGDYTLVIDTTGVDDRTWLDEGGHPHTVDAHFQERYTRLDQYNMQLTMTVDDPKFYTKPFEFLKGTFYWMAKQDFEETFCIPSDGIAYRDSLALPAGTGNESPK